MVVEKNIATEDGIEIPIRTYVPLPLENAGEQSNQTYPLIVWYHGTFSLVITRSLRFMTVLKEVDIV